MATDLPDIAAGRLPAADYAANFADLRPPLDHHQALVEADRCYFCYDAPCVAACPTGIDVPLFIRQIQTGTPKEAARTILDQNIFGGMCARACPTEVLCEEACVREIAEGKPVKIGLLQRHATDALMAAGEQPFAAAAPTGRRVAIVGGGPAGLACAHRLALHGHAVTVFEARPRLGGLNEYGIAAYKTVDDFAAAEVAFVLAIGGIAVETGRRLGADFSLDDLVATFDAVFLGIGLGAVNALGLANEAAATDAVTTIADLRQLPDLATLPVGRRIVVIGGGMTAIDIADQTRRLGAHEVTIVYRRGPDAMPASPYERDVALRSGVRILFNAAPKRLVVEHGVLRGIEFGRTILQDGALVETGEPFRLDADQVFKAVGQRLEPASLAGAAIALEGGRIAVDAERRTSLAKVWAGGDCATGGKDLTVRAVADGRIAAESIHALLSA